MADFGFQTLLIEGWRQFDRVELTLHPRLTIITGANGSGKSTLLSFFSRHFGWQRPYLAVPKRDQNGVIRYSESFLSYIWSIFKRREQNERNIGYLVYSNRSQATISVPRSNSVQYSVDISNQQTVYGLHIDSYRPAPVYQTLPNIPLQALTSQQAYDSYNNELLHNFAHIGYTGSSPMLRMKEAMISMAIFGEGNSAVGSNSVLRATYDGFNDVLKLILPETLGFIRISVRAPEVVLETRSGEFMLDASSGGIMTLIDIAWRIYMFSLNRSSFVVTMDEPENHLHPSMQRSLMRRLIDAFPTAQFIVATHSPFIVTSVKDSNVFVLRYRQENDQNRDPVGPSSASRVYSLPLETINKAASASDIFHEVLGVPATMPEWVEVELEAIVRQYQGREINTKLLADLRDRLKVFGFEEYYPNAIASITAGR